MNPEILGGVVLVFLTVAGFVVGFAALTVIGYGTGVLLGHIWYRIKRRRKARRYLNHMKGCPKCRVWVEIIEENRAQFPAGNRFLSAEQRDRIRAAADRVQSSTGHAE